MPYLERLDTVAEEVIYLLSETINVNTIFLATNDGISNFIVKAFNRNAVLLNAGESAPFNNVLCKLAIDHGQEPIVIPDLANHPKTVKHPITLEIGNGCFLGSPIFKSNGDIYGTICAFDNTPYNFSPKDIRLLKALISLLSQTIYLEEMITRDYLTGLYNKFFLNTFFEELKMKPDSAYTLLYLDLDNFKQINDTYGHEIGDRVLIQVAKMLEKITPTGSIVARIGGDEFIMLLPLKELQVEEATTLAQQLLTDLSTHPLYVDDIPFHMSASVGFTLLDPYQELEKLIKEADEAMYDSKRSGKGKITFRH